MTVLYFSVVYTFPDLLDPHSRFWHHASHRAGGNAWRDTFFPIWFFDRLCSQQIPSATVGNMHFRDMKLARNAADWPGFKRRRSISIYDLLSQPLEAVRTGEHCTSTLIIVDVQSHSIGRSLHRSSSGRRYRAQTFMHACEF